MPTVLEDKQGRGKVLFQKQLEIAARFQDAEAYKGKEEEYRRDLDLFHQYDQELADNQKEVNALKAMAGARDRLNAQVAAWEDTRPVDLKTQGIDGLPQQATKSLGQLFTESDAYLTQKNESKPKITFDAKGLELRHQTQMVKAVMTEAAGFAPANPRSNIVIPSAQRRPVVADLIPQDAVNVTLIRYMRINGFPAGAAAVAEGALKPLSTLTAVEVDSPVQTIATVLPVTNQQLEDVPQIRALIDTNLTLALELEEDRELLLGSGTTPEITGLMNVSGIQTTARDLVPTPNETNADAVYDAFVKVMIAAFTEATGVIMHPTNWKTIRLMKTTYGDYIYGPPSVPGPETLWGKPVVKTVVMTLNTALTGDFAQFAHISRRMAMRVDVGMANDDFLRNQQSIRVEERLSLEVYRPNAFCTITVLN